MLCDAFWALGAKRRSKRVACWRSATDHVYFVRLLFKGIRGFNGFWSMSVFDGKMGWAQ
jgi:hypothetical protein